MRGQQFLTCILRSSFEFPHVIAWKYTNSRLQVRYIILRFIISIIVRNHEILLEIPVSKPNERKYCTLESIGKLLVYSILF